MKEAAPPSKVQPLLRAPRFRKSREPIKYTIIRSDFQESTIFVSCFHIILTSTVLYVYIKTVLKRGDEMGTKKMGRPTDDPKPYQISVKFNEACKEVLEAYCAQENVKRMEAIRRGIMKLKGDLKK